MIDSDIRQALTKIVGPENISDGLKVRHEHSKDKSFHKPTLPGIVVWPASTREVSEILKIANRHAIPIVAWGGASSTEGNPIPILGGIVLDTGRMDKVLEVYPEDLQVRTQPGIIGSELDGQLLSYGLFFPPAPGSKSIATVGGMIANNAGGMHAVRYGVVGDWVLELEVVLANGDIIRTGSRSFKSVSGYDLKRLFVGSEGTLGIITEAVLKLAPIPEEKVSLTLSFERTGDAVTAALALLRLQPDTVEFLGKPYVEYINQITDIALPVRPALLIEFHGTTEVILQKARQVKNRKSQWGFSTIREYRTPAERESLWRHRSKGRTALHSVYPGMGILAAEAGLPLSETAGFLEQTEKLSKKHSLKTLMFGHLGDGNFHGWTLYELDNPESYERATELNEELIHLALSLGGTVSGEHGIGIGKRKYLAKEHPTSLPVMKSIKDLLDPKGILNPGKVFLR